MHLIIQIPCFNEEQTLPAVLDDLPEDMPGIDTMEVVVIDDGSEDQTSKIAKEAGCTVLQHESNRGLGEAFRTGLAHARHAGADILVNTDGDNQYPGEKIRELVETLVSNRVDIVIGDRQPGRVQHFSRTKQFFQRLGSLTVSSLAGVTVNDAVSGFRAYGKDAIANLHPTTKFSYVLDTLMQAQADNLTITSIPIVPNETTRESRLFDSMWQHIWQSGKDILRLYTIYKPFKTFLYTGLVPFIAGSVIGIRFLYFLIQGDGSGHIQSLIAASILIIAAVILFALGVIGELLRTNRDVSEQLFRELRQQTSK